MLLEFRVSNFRSIKGEQVFSMFPANKLRERPSALLKVDGYEDLYAIPSAAIYGPNNAGKSNFLRAFRALKWLVGSSAGFNVGDRLLANEFFELDILTKDQPTSLWIHFVANDGLRYEYQVAFDRERILLEELLVYPLDQLRTYPAKLFHRKFGRPIEFGDSLKGPKKTIEDELLENQLFLSKAVQNKNTQLAPVFLFFKEGLDLSVFHNEEYDEIQMASLGKMIYENKDEPLVDLIETILIHAGTGIIGLEIAQSQEVPTVTFPEGFPEDKKAEIIRDFNERFKFKIKTKHRLYKGDEEVGTTTMPLKEQSTGTIKFFNIIRLALNALAGGKVLLVDELDKSLHPNLTEVIINLFHNQKTNPRKAQLIFATHDVSLLSADLFGRDQMYLIEKDPFGASQITSIADFKGVRQNVPFEKWYLSGRFNATPKVNKFQIENEITHSPIFDE